MNPNFKETGLVTHGKVFLLILLALIGVFIFSNTSVILSRLGFETATTLKAQLVQTQADLDRAVELNLQKDNELIKERTMTKALTEQLDKLNTVTTVANEQVQKVQNEKRRKTEVIITKVKSSEVQGEDIVQLPRVEIDQLSSANIEQVTEVFETLFPSQAA